ncbi:MAG: hypothetical protein HXS52_07390 [Theionarchaea archaeon]|nr:hypothetical protein [Theionarchaea archaeon]MBU7037740.1 hypothetical protein [Theionarchaea archaeon]
MALEERETFSMMVRIIWMLLSHKHASLRFRRISPLVKKALNEYEEKMNSLAKSPHCLGSTALMKHGLLKERYWRAGILMAAATSLPVLYETVTEEELVQAVCAKASVSTSAKLLDNLNDMVHTYAQAVHSLSGYESALARGSYHPDGTSDVARAESSAHEIASWVHTIMMTVCGNPPCARDIELLISGQIASIQHKRGDYPSMQTYLSQVCERSIGNMWIDVDLTFLPQDKSSSLKKGNDYIFKSYLLYDDIQDIREDIRTNSVNSALIMGMERGLLRGEEIVPEKTEDIIRNLDEAGIFWDILSLGDLIFLEGLETVSQCGSSIDRKGLAASLGLIRMFNLRRTLKRERSIPVLGEFLAGRRRLVQVRETVPDRIQDLANCVA